MPGRTIAQIDDLIAHRESDLRALHEERRQVMKARNADVVAQFLSGKSFGDIADQAGLTYSTVQGICFKEGLTEKVRTAMGHRAAEQATA
jgi:DNA-binding CsgD family transcriptional regulator